MPESRIFDRDDPPQPPTAEAIAQRIESLERQFLRLVDIDSSLSSDTKSQKLDVARDVLRWAKSRKDREDTVKDKRSANTWSLITGIVGTLIAAAILHFLGITK